MNFTDYLQQRKAESRQLNNLIKSKRLERGWTMKDLAERVGVSEGTVSRWESGEIANMRRSTISKVVKVLDIPIEAFINIEPKTTEPTKSPTGNAAADFESRVSRYMAVNGLDRDQAEILAKAESIDKETPENKVRQLILSRFVNLKLFAETIQMPYSTLLAILGNMQNTTVANLQKIATGLNTTLDGLTGAASAESSSYSPVLARAQEELSPEDLAKVEEIAAMYLKMKKEDK